MTWLRPPPPLPSFLYRQHSSSSSDVCVQTVVAIHSKHSTSGSQTSSSCVKREGGCEMKGGEGGFISMTEEIKREAETQFTGRVVGG